MPVEERRRPAVGRQVRHWRFGTRPHPGGRRRAERSQRGVPVPDRERQGVAVPRLPCRAGRRAGGSHRLVPGRRGRDATRSSERASAPSRRVPAGRASNGSMGGRHATSRSSRRRSGPANGREPTRMRRRASRHRQRPLAPDPGRPRRGRRAGRLHPLGRHRPPRRRGVRRRAGHDPDRQPPDGSLTVAEADSGPGAQGGPDRRWLVRTATDRVLGPLAQPQLGQDLAAEGVDELGLVAPDVVEVDLVEAHVE